MDWISHKGHEHSMEIDNSNSLSKQEIQALKSNMEPGFKHLHQQNMHNTSNAKNMKKSEEEKNMFINIIINNNNNNNFLMRPNNAVKGGFDLSPNVHSTKKDKFLLDFTHKYNKKIYEHRKETKRDLSYPDVPPNSFNFDEFDVMGFLDSIKTLGNIYRSEATEPRPRNLSIKMLDHSFDEDTHKFEAIAPVPKANHQHRQVQKRKEEARMVYYSSKPKPRKDQDLNQKDFRNRQREASLRFSTCNDMKENAALQIRKIKFFWRGTQTNLPYIFKRQMKEINTETLESEFFEKFEYSKKKIKTNNHEDSN